MTRATGGVAVAAISIRSKPSSGRASFRASARDKTPRFSPFSPITRSSGAVIKLLILGLIMGVVEIPLRVLSLYCKL